MSDLSIFLKQNKTAYPNAKFAASTTFIDPETGEPALWEVKVISVSQEQEIRRSCTKMVSEGKTKRRKNETLDDVSYFLKVAVASTVFPNLGDVDLQQSYGVMGAENLLKAMLSPGELLNYQNFCSQVNGFDIGMEELVEEAKN